MREFQRHTTQWGMGKNFDRTGGFGPWMVTADELPRGGKGLKIESRLNGKTMQSDNTDNMMFPVAETLVYLTEGMTLEPGDIMFTGTPSGVGHARKPEPVWMKAGDTIEVEIEGVGVLRNPIEDEKAAEGARCDIGGYGRPVERAGDLRLAAQGIVQRRADARAARPGAAGNEAHRGAADRRLPALQRRRPGRRPAFRRRPRTLGRRGARGRCGVCS